MAFVPFGDKMNDALSDQAAEQAETASPVEPPAETAAPEPVAAATPPRKRHRPYIPVAIVRAQRAAAQRVLDEARAARAREQQARAAATPPTDPIDNDTLAEDLIAELADRPAVTPAPSTSVTISMDQLLALLATQKGGGFDEAALTRVLMTTQEHHAKASATAMQTALNRSNPNYVAKSPYHDADGKEAIPKYIVFFGPQFTSGKGAPLPRDLFTPDERDLINRFEPGKPMVARKGEWTGEVIRNGSTQELILKVPMTTMDQRQNLPSFALILRELLDGDAAVNPDTLAARVAELERQLAAPHAAA